MSAPDFVHGCPGCTVNARLAHGDVDRIVASYLATNPQARLANQQQYSARLALCSECPDLMFGSTCRHCGCLVAVRARLAEKTCPATAPKW